MKYIKPLIILIFVASLIIYSCSTENSDIDRNIETGIIKAKSVEFFGIEHNKMLEEAYQFLENQSKNESLKNKSNKIKKQNLEDFLISIVETDGKYSESVKQKGIENIRNVFNQKLTLSKVLNTHKSKSSISNIEETYLKKLEEIIDKVDFNLENGISDKIIDLEKEIENDETLKNEQLLVLFSATQTAKYSYTYWKENWEKWVALQEIPNKVLKHNNAFSKNDEECTDGHCGCNCEDAKDIVKADVAGAAGAAVGAAAANIVVGPGTVAYGGAIVAGGVGNSVVEGVKKLLDWLWD